MKSNDIFRRNTGNYSLIKRETYAVVHVCLLNSRCFENNNNYHYQDHYNELFLSVQVFVCVCADTISNKNYVIIHEKKAKRFQKY